MNSVTIFTPTFNRGYIIQRLIDSLLKQTVYAFKWLVIDDGSTDNTADIFNDLIKKELPFPIQYLRVENGGKQRAINRAVELIDTDYIFIVDSDDYLVPEAVEKVMKWINDEAIDDSFAGVSGVKGFNEKKPVGDNLIKMPNGYIDATNLERNKYGLSADMAEVYKTEVLRKYPFQVYPGENFVPEATVWDQIAADGYKLRWNEDIIYICNYLEDGLTKQSWRLLKDNPMGYARLFDMQLGYTQDKKASWNKALQMTTCFILAKHWTSIFTSNDPIRALICSPVAAILSLKRKYQFKKYI